MAIKSTLAELTVFIKGNVDDLRKKLKSQGAYFAKQKSNFDKFTKQQQQEALAHDRRLRGGYVKRIRAHKAYLKALEYADLGYLNKKERTTIREIGKNFKKTGKLARKDIEKVRAILTDSGTRRDTDTKALKAKEAAWKAHLRRLEKIKKEHIARMKQLDKESEQGEKAAWRQQRSRSRNAKKFMADSTKLSRTEEAETLARGRIKRAAAGLTKEDRKLLTRKERNFVEAAKERLRREGNITTRQWNRLADIHENLLDRKNKATMASRKREVAYDREIEKRTKAKKADDLKKAREKEAIGLNKGRFKQATAATKFTPADEKLVTRKERAYLNAAKERIRREGSLTARQWSRMADIAENLLDRKNKATMASRKREVAYDREIEKRTKAKTETKLWDDRIASARKGIKKKEDGWFTKSWINKKTGNWFQGNWMNSKYFTEDQKHYLQHIKKKEAAGLKTTLAEKKKLASILEKYEDQRREKHEKQKEERGDFRGQVGVATAGFLREVSQLGKSVLSEGIKFDIQFEQSEVAFTTLMGDANLAKETLLDIEKFAADTQFTLPDVLPAARQLIAFGKTGDDLMNTLYILGNAAAGTSTDFADVARIFDIVVGEGKLTRRTFYQLARRGLILKEDLAEFYNIPVEQVFEKMQRGEITAKDMQQIFENLSAEGGRFHDMMIRQAETLGGKWNKLTDALGITLRMMVESLRPISKAILDMALNALTFIRELDKETLRLIGGAIAGATAVASIGSALLPVIALARLFGITMKAALVGTGIGALLVALGAIAGYFMVLNKTDVLEWLSPETVKAVIDKFKEWGKILWTYIQPAIQWLWKAWKYIQTIVVKNLDLIVDIGKAAGQLIYVTFLAIFDIIKAISSLLGLELLGDMTEMDQLVNGIFRTGLLRIKIILKGLTGIIASFAEGFAQVSKMLEPLVKPFFQILWDVLSYTMSIFSVLTMESNFTADYMEARFEQMWLRVFKYATEQFGKFFDNMSNNPLFGNIFAAAIPGVGALRFGKGGSALASLIGPTDEEIAAADKKVKDLWADINAEQRLKSKEYLNELPEGLKTMFGISTKKGPITGALDDVKSVVYAIKEATNKATPKPIMQSRFPVNYERANLSPGVRGLRDSHRELQDMLLGEKQDMDKQRNIYLDEINKNSKRTADALENFNPAARVGK